MWSRNSLGSGRVANLGFDCRVVIASEMLWVLRVFTEICGRELLVGRREAIYLQWLDTVNSQPQFTSRSTSKRTFAQHHYIFPLTTRDSLHRDEHTRLPFRLLALHTNSTPTSTQPSSQTHISSTCSLKFLKKSSTI